MQFEPDTYRELTKGVSAKLGTLRSGAPDVMKSFSELGRFAMSDGALSKKTKELMALALGVAARCDPCIGYHMQALVKLGVSRQELDETLGVAVYWEGAPPSCTRPMRSPHSRSSPAQWLLRGRRAKVR